MASQLKKRNKMYLLTKNLKIKKKSKKLDHVKIELFFIKVIKEPINYELDLSKNVKVFPIFYISLLELVDLNTSIQETFHYKAQKESRYKVKRILKQQDQSYLIKWKGYSTSKNTWKLEKNLDDCHDFI